jgi:hypothetical protein
MPVTEGRKVAKVTVISPDSAEEKTLDTLTDSTGVHFKTPEIGTYSVVVVNWR